MISIKNKEEIKKMRQGGKILGKVVSEAKKKVKIGVSKKELDDYIRTLIYQHKAKPSFMMVSGYKWASCITVNCEVVHGIPTDYCFKNGDLVGIDVGVYYDGFHTDKAETVLVSDGKKDFRELVRFLEVGREALKIAINTAAAGKCVGQISYAIQRTVEKGGYQPVRSLVGHGVGKKLHEDPAIPGYLGMTEIKKTGRLEAGMTLAIEVIYNKGRYEVNYKNDDGWTIVTRDQSVSGLFEETVLVTSREPEVLTA